MRLWSGGGGGNIDALVTLTGWSVSVVLVRLDRAGERHKRKLAEGEIHSVTASLCF